MSDGLVTLEGSVDAWAEREDVLGTGAAMLMDHIWYVAAARGSERVLGLYRRLTSWCVDETSVDQYFVRYGTAIIVLGRFFTSIRALAWPVAAARGVGYARFFVLDLFAATLWTSLWVLLGLVVGERWASAAETAAVWLGIGGAVALAVAVVPIALRLGRRRARRRTARRSGAPAGR